MVVAPHGAGPSPAASDFSHSNKRVKINYNFVDDRGDAKQSGTRTEVLFYVVFLCPKIANSMLYNFYTENTPWL